MRIVVNCVFILLKRIQKNQINTCNVLDNWYHTMVMKSVNKREPPESWICHVRSKHYVKNVSEKVLSSASSCTNNSNNKNNVISYRFGSHEIVNSHNIIHNVGQLVPPRNSWTIFFQKSQFFYHFQFSRISNSKTTNPEMSHYDFNIFLSS